MFTFHTPARGGSSNWSRGRQANFLLTAWVGLSLASLPAQSLRLNEAWLCEAAYDAQSLTTLAKNMADRKAQWENHDGLVRPDMIGKLNGQPTFSITGATVAAILKACQAKQGNLVEIPSNHELQMVDDFLTTHEISDISIYLTVDTTTSEPLVTWPRSGSLFQFTTIADRVIAGFKADPKTFYGILVYNRENRQFSPQVKANIGNAPALCMEPPSTTSKMAAELVIEAKLTMERLDTDFPVRKTISNLLLLMDPSVTIPDDRKASTTTRSVTTTIKPKFPQCWPTTITFPISTDLPGVPSIANEGDVLTARKKLRKFSSKVSSIHKLLVGILAKLQAADDVGAQLEPPAGTWLFRKFDLSRAHFKVILALALITLLCSAIGTCIFRMYWAIYKKPRRSVHHYQAAEDIPIEEL